MKRNEHFRCLKSSFVNSADCSVYKINCSSLEFHSTTLPVSKKRRLQKMPKFIPTVVMSYRFIKEIKKSKKVYYKTRKSSTDI